MITILAIFLGVLIGAGIFHLFLYLKDEGHNISAALLLILYIGGCLAVILVAEHEQDQGRERLACAFEAIKAEETQAFCDSKEILIRENKWNENLVPTCLIINEQYIYN